MKKIYILLMGTMLATTASAQISVEDRPTVNIPEGYRLDSTYIECWHPRYNQGKHQPDMREEFRYDSQGRKTLYLQFSFTRYIEDEEGVTHSYLLDNPDLWEQVRYHYTDKGEMDRETRRSYDFYEHEWMDDFTIYSDFDETTGLPRVFWYMSGKYEEGDEAAPDWLYTEIVKYHGNTPETAYLYKKNFETEEWEMICSYQREFNEWGGISHATRHYHDEYSTGEEDTTYDYDEHHNLTAILGIYRWEDGEESIYKPKFINEYDEDGMLVSTIERPGNTDGFFTKTFYYWSKTEDPSGITAMPVNEKKPDAWYDLSGRRLTGQPSHPGLYIKDGKKVAVK